jgi:regulator of protease activity HflC (stomatin/prohibitin superfamily)
MPLLLSVAAQRATSSTSLILLCIVAVGMIVWLILALRIVPEHQRLVVFRLGRLIGARGPGLLLLVPFVDKGVLVDLREQTRTLEGERIITQDNARLVVDLMWTFRLVDPDRSVGYVANLENSMRENAITLLHALLERQTRDDVLTGRGAVNTQLHALFREAAASWGVDIVQVELRSVRRE